MALATVPMYDYNVKDYGALGNYGVTYDAANARYVANPADDVSLTKDDSAAIQSVLNIGKTSNGLVVYIPAGYYALKSTLRLYSGTTVIMHPGAYLIRNSASMGYFFTNEGDEGSNYSGYGGQGNIKIIGGNMDGNYNKSGIVGSFNFISLGHGHDIEIRDVRFFDLLTYHAIEINSSTRVKVRNCLFDGWKVASNYSDQSRLSEAIQFDGMVSSAEFGAFGSYDDTACEDILIEGCHFRNWCRGIGTHTGSALGAKHKYIKIQDNHFQDLTKEGIVSCMWEQVVIQGNTFHGGDNAIWLRVKDTTAYNAHDISIVNNSMIGQTDRAIYCDGQDPNGTVTNQIYGINITGNTIRSSTGIGIYLVHCRRVVVSSNTIHDGASGGIWLRYCNEGVVANNNIYNCTGDDGIRLSTSVYINVNGNQMNNVGGHGIGLLYADAADTSGSCNNSIIGNIIRDIADNDNGVYVSGGSNYNLVSGNTFATLGTGTKGIYVTSTCSGNNVVGNKMGGFVLTDNGASYLSANS
jgi:parallel beta-helix repeat protein